MDTTVKNEKRGKLQSQDPELVNLFIAEEGAEVVDELEQLWSDLDYANPTRDSELQSGIEQIKSKHRQNRFKKAIKTISVSVASTAAVFAIMIYVMNSNAWNERKIDSEICSVVEKSAQDNNVIVKMGDYEVVAQTNSMQLENLENGTKVILNGGKNTKDIVNSIEKISICVPRGKTFKLTMIDGTEINLNSDTQLEYNSDFAKKDRSVTIHGEAYFQVTKNPRKPFIVNVADHYSIRVLGTSFNVNDYGSTEMSYTTLVEGSIEIQTKDKKKMSMSPNDQINFKPQTGDYEIKVVNPCDAMAWMDGMMNFDNITLQELTCQLERAYNIEIEIADRLKSLRFSGSINRSRGIENILKMIKSTYDIDYNVQNSVLKIQ